MVVAVEAGCEAVAGLAAARVAAARGRAVAARLLDADLDVPWLAGRPCELACP